MAGFGSLLRAGCRSRRTLFAIGLSAIMLAGLMAQISASQSAINGIISGACALYQDVRIAILITGVVLILIGGALYAIGHLVSGEDHAANGYGIGLAIAGIIAVIR